MSAVCCCRLREVHGNDWATIGAVLGRSAGSVRDRCRLMKGSCRYGTWEHEEEMNLALAVYELSGAQPGEEVRVYLFIIHFMLVLNLDWSNYLLVHVSLVHLLILFCQCIYKPLYTTSAVVGTSWIMLG